MKPRIPFLGGSLVIGLILLGITGQAAKADLYSFDSSNGDPNSGPYGSVTVTGGGTTVTITVTAASGYQLNSFGFNVASGTTLALSSPFSISPNWSISPGNGSSGVGSQNQGGLGPYGKFSYKVSDESASDVTSLTITVSGTSLTTAQFEGLSTGGTSVTFAAHMKPYGGGSGNTYMYGAHPSAVTPEPSTLALAGLGTLGFIGYGLRRRLKTCQHPDVGTTFVVPMAGDDLPPPMGSRPHGGCGLPAPPAVEACRRDFLNLANPPFGIRNS